MYQKLLKWCKDSEVILASRLQVFVGVLLTLVSIALPLVSSQDLSVFISDPKLLAAFSIISGVGMELLRRHRATEVDDPAGGSITLLK